MDYAMQMRWGARGGLTLISFCFLIAIIIGLV